MKITDPSLPSTLLGPLRFDHLDASAECDAGYILRTHGAPVARLVPRRLQDGMLVLDGQDSVLGHKSSWSLDFFWGEGSFVGTHVFWCDDANASSVRLTVELAAWAALMVLWGMVPRTPQQG
jgi:hypothetical protein